MKFDNYLTDLSLAFQFEKLFFTETELIKISRKDNKELKGKKSLSSVAAAGLEQEWARARVPGPDNVPSINLNAKQIILAYIS